MSFEITARCLHTEFLGSETEETEAGMLSIAVKCFCHVSLFQISQY